MDLDFVVRQFGSWWINGKLFSPLFIAEKLERARQMTKSKKSSCPFCKDEKNQPLKAYLLRRSREKKNSKICEEDEEVAEEEEQKCCTSGQNHTQQKKWTIYFIECWPQFVGHTSGWMHNYKLLRNNFIV